MGFPLSISDFTDAFPRFTATATERPVFVQKKLDAAARSIDPDVWGDRAEDGHGNLAAHLLETDPHGADARLVDKDGSTTYSREFERLQGLVGGANRVVLP